MDGPFFLQKNVFQSKIEKCQHLFHQPDLGPLQTDKEWKQTDSDDKLAAETVKSAKDVLTKWYKENSFLQQGPVTGMAAGEAPPPPPPTNFGGAKTGESQGRLLISQDVGKIGFISGTEYKYSRKSAENQFSQHPD